MSQSNETGFSDVFFCITYVTRRRHQQQNNHNKVIFYAGFVNIGKSADTILNSVVAYSAFHSIAIPPISSLH